MDGGKPYEKPSTERAATRSQRRARKSFEVADRRHNVALLMRAGLSQKEIAGLVGVSEATLHDDVAALKAMWADDAMSDVDRLVRTELASLDLDEARLRVEMLDCDTYAGMLRVYDTILAIKNRRAQLVGLDSVLRRKNSEQRAPNAGLDELLTSLLNEDEGRKTK